MGDPAAVPIVLDTNVIKNIAEGNSAAAEALTRLMKNGTKVYIARAAYNELVTDAATPQLRSLYRNLLRDAGIRIAPKSAAGPRMNVYADNIMWDEQIEKQNAARAKRGKGPKGNVGAMDEYGGHSKARPGDVFVAAETRSLNARLWTLDKRFANQARRAGVAIAQESGIDSVPGGTEDVPAARKMLGLEASARPASGGPVAGDVKAREIVAEPPTGGRSGGSGRPGGSAGPRGRAGGGRTGGRTGGVRGGGRSGFGLGAVWVETFYPEIAEQAKKERQQAEAERRAAAIEQKMLAHEKVIDERIAKMKLDIAAMQLRKDDNEKVYANVVVEVIHYESSPYGKGGSLTSTDDVNLLSVDVTTRNLNQQRNHTRVIPEQGWAGTGNVYNIERKIDEYTYSFEVRVYTDQEVAYFNKLAGEYWEYKRRLGIPPYEEIIAESLAEVRKEIVDSFGSDVWIFAAE